MVILVVVLLAGDADNVAMYTLINTHDGMSRYAVPRYKVSSNETLDVIIIRKISWHVTDIRIILWLRFLSLMTNSQQQVVKARTVEHPYHDRVRRRAPRFHHN